MYNDMYRDFSDQSFEYNYPITFEKRNKEYLQPQYTPFKEWCYGDDVTLTFTLKTGEVPEGARVLITFFNFRYEIVKALDLIDWAQTITVNIDSKTSKEVFKRGNYYCMLQIISGTEENPVVKTAIAMNDCLLYVK